MACNFLAVAGFYVRRSAGVSPAIWAASRRPAENCFRKENLKLLVHRVRRRDAASTAGETPALPNQQAS